MKKHKKYPVIILKCECEKIPPIRTAYTAYVDIKYGSASANSLKAV